MMHPTDIKDIGVVVIGRNEGERLRTCIRSTACITAVVYVDSGSSDGSADWARAQGVDVVDLAVPPNFTAARARNVGLKWLEEQFPDLAFVQMIDGDCELSVGWLAAGRAALLADPELVGVFGRLRERHPERSIYNAMCDEEWDIPLGEAYGFGGIVLLRIEAVRAAGGYNPNIIAAEDTELSRRLRDAGWKIACIDEDMALHDAAISRFSEWWTRTRRSGHAFAELARLHPGSTWPNWKNSCRSVAVWGGAIPVLAIAGALGSITLSLKFSVLSLALVALWLAKIVQIAMRKRRFGRKASYAWRAAAYLMFGKIVQLLGVATYYRNQFLGRASRLIEYKGPEAA